MSEPSVGIPTNSTHPAPACGYFVDRSIDPGAASVTAPAPLPVRATIGSGATSPSAVEISGAISGGTYDRPVGRGGGDRASEAIVSRSQDPAEALFSDVELGRLIELFESLCPEPDGVWSCDGGAAFAAWLCDQLGFERRLRSGFFWHPSEESYNETMGYAEGSEDWATWRDEAHCWVEVDRPYGTVLLDPNSERLPDPLPRAFLYDTANGLRLADDGEWIDGGYEPCNSERDCVNYAVDEDVEKLAEHDAALAGAIAQARKLLAA